MEERKSNSQAKMHVGLKQFMCYQNIDLKYYQIWIRNKYFIFLSPSNHGHSEIAIMMLNLGQS